MDDLNLITAISAVDGRYRGKIKELAPIVSEYGLIRNRVQVECEWFLFLSHTKEIKEIREIGDADVLMTRDIYLNFSDEDAERIKEIESETNHDVKAVEYFVKAKLQENQNTEELAEWVHFGCTSEDINNTAYAIMLQKARSTIMLNAMNSLVAEIESLAKLNASLAMLSRTHGQVASPTTLGKELKNVSERLKRQINQLESIEILGKFNGAVGNFNADYAAYPEVNWVQLSDKFLRGLDLKINRHTTQLDPHDYIAEIFDCIKRFNQILLDFDRDIWSYVSIDYFKQKKIEGETGSSTMPHKINPIDFENSEGNLGIANALLEHMSAKLVISRLQRDLSDSTVLRNIGSTLGHCLLAYKSTLKGLTRLEVNDEKISKDISESWEVLAEPVQTIMRKYGMNEPYEQLKKATRGRQIDEALYQSILTELELPKEAVNELRSLRPENYIGLAIELTNDES